MYIFIGDKTAAFIQVFLINHEVTRVYSNYSLFFEFTSSAKAQISRNNVVFEKISQKFILPK